jgi:hypothetical protein
VTADFTIVIVNRCQRGRAMRHTSYSSALCTGPKLPAYLQANKREQPALAVPDRSRSIVGRLFDQTNCRFAEHKRETLSENDPLKQTALKKQTQSIQSIIPPPSTPMRWPAIVIFGPPGAPDQGDKTETKSKRRLF